MRFSHNCDFIPLDEDDRYGTGSGSNLAPFISHTFLRITMSLPLPVQSVNREIRQGRGFFICHSRVDICHCLEIAQLTLGTEPGSPLTMTNIKSQMTNDKWNSSFISRFTDSTCAPSAYAEAQFVPTPGVRGGNFPGGLRCLVACSYE